MRTQVNLAVFVSGGGTNLQALIDARSSGRLKSAEICLVVSDRAEAYACERARRHGIPVEILTEDSSVWEAKVQEVLQRYQIDFIVLAGFLRILSKEFTQKYSRRILNVHPSLIPSFCGAGFYGLKVHEAALAKGVKVTGATVHFVNEIPDGGEILAQKAVRVQAGDTPRSLQRRVMRLAEHVLLPQVTEAVAAELLREEEKHASV